MGSGHSKGQEGNLSRKPSPCKDQSQPSTDRNTKQRSNQNIENTPRKHPPNQNHSTKPTSTSKDNLANENQRYSNGKQTVKAANHKSTPRPQPTNQSPKQFRPSNQNVFRPQQSVQFEDRSERNKGNKFDHISLYDVENEEHDMQIQEDKLERSERRQVSSENRNNGYSSDKRGGNIDELEQDIYSNTQKYMTTPRLKKEKIETALRSSRVPETKVRHLAAHLSYTPSDETVTVQEQELYSMERLLRKTFNSELDPILFGTRGKTNLSHYDKNPQGLAKKVFEMVQQINFDLQNCMDNLDAEAEDEEEFEDEDFEYKQMKEKHQEIKKHTQTKVQKQTNGWKTKSNKMIENKKSLILTLQNGIRDMKTNYEILLERYENLLKENKIIGSNNEKNEAVALAFQDENLKLEKDINSLKEKLTHCLTGIEQANEVHYKLRTKLKETEIEKDNLIQQNDRLLNMTKGLTRELNKLQDETARTAVENIQLTKEFRRLQGPDKKVKRQIQRLEADLQEMRTQNRRLENEKGAIRATLQKLEATHEVIQVDRKFLVREKEALVKEMNNLKAEKRKLILSG